ncbi:MAG: molybdenum cofactor biosynthesis protein MoaE [Acidimicrobiia bacterium]|nr:molybdenum cofactor biosynthesis protein MoaE [Acidimicrobiia bacterium]
MTLPAPSIDTWVGVADEPLPAASVDAWVRGPDCGAVVTFTGMVRDHAEGRAGVTALSYEAYEEHATSRIADVVAEARRRWPAVRRVAAVHRIGDLAVGDDAVIVAVASPHRGEAFAAAEYVIDTVKETVPIWKRETWADGQSWGVDAHAIREVGVREDASR